MRERDLPGARATRDYLRSTSRLSSAAHPTGTSNRFDQPASGTLVRGIRRFQVTRNENARRFMGTGTGVSRFLHTKSHGEGSMRGYPLTAAILAASFCVLPVRVPSAEDIHQPKGAPPASADANYNEDAWQTILPYQNVLGVLGKDVRSSAGENLGRIIDVLVDQGGQVRAAVIDFGGFLGVGNRRIVVDWVALHFAPADQRDRITLNLTRDQIRAVLEYKAGKPVIVLTAIPEM